MDKEKGICMICNKKRKTKLIYTAGVTVWGEICNKCDKELRDQYKTYMKIIKAQGA